MCVCCVCICFCSVFSVLFFVRLIVVVFLPLLQAIVAVAEDQCLV